FKEIVSERRSHQGEGGQTGGEPHVGVAERGDCHERGKVAVEEDENDTIHPPEIGAFERTYLARQNQIRNEFLQHGDGPPLPPEKSPSAVPTDQRRIAASCSPHSRTSEVRPRPDLGRAAPARPCRE